MLYYRIVLSQIYMGYIALVNKAFDELSCYFQLASLIILHLLASNE